MDTSKRMMQQIIEAWPALEDDERQVMHESEYECYTDAVSQLGRFMNDVYMHKRIRALIRDNSYYHLFSSKGQSEMRLPWGHHKVVGCQWVRFLNEATRSQADLHAIVDENSTCELVIDCWAQVL